jgi:tripartite-type tricarboxylate transporter receptor subunit TctC
MRSLAMLAGIMFSASVLAQVWPARPVKFVVPFPPGGATDIIARLQAQKMTEAWGQPVVVENRSGASGAIGSVAVAKSDPDGYTILMGTTSTHAVSPAIKPDLPYSLNDFTAVTLVATFPNVLVAHPATARTLADLIALIKANPGKFAFGSSGAGSSTHLTGELFKQMTKADVTHVPYKGTGPLLNDLMGGQVAFAFDQITAVMGPVQAGKMRALGVASAERNAALPDVPAIRELLPGFESTAWVGILAPAKTPAEVANRIQAETKRVLALPDVSQRLKDLGATPVASTPADFSAFMRKDMEKWRTLVQTANIKVEQ